VYHQPLVLGSRQAGAAIEGAVRQRVAPAIDQVAVDTHGYTDFAMGLARLLGFDLCPRLKGLRDRRLHVPVGFAVPEAIASITRAGVVPSTIESEWAHPRAAGRLDPGRHDERDGRARAPGLGLARRPALPRRHDARADRAQPAALRRGDESRLPTHPAEVRPTFPRNQTLQMAMCLIRLQ